MRTADLAAFQAALAQLRDVNARLDKTDAGVCLIHLDAAIAALESRIRRHGMTAVDLQADAAREAAEQLATPATDVPGV